MAVAALLAVIAVSGAIGKVMAAPLDVEMWRLDCGEFKDFNIEYHSDVFAYPGKKKTLSNGCYLIRHEKEFMLWDTGFSPSSLSKYKPAGAGMSQTLLVQLQKINIKPEQISIIGLSHLRFRPHRPDCQRPEGAAITWFPASKDFPPLKTSLHGSVRAQTRKRLSG